MEQVKYIKLFNPKLNIGLVNWREAWLFSSEYPEKLFIEVHKGKLVFRQRGSSVRISYQQIKKGLIKKEMMIKEQPLPF
jgi:hypothetical protein